MSDIKDNWAILPLRTARNVFIYYIALFIFGLLISIVAILPEFEIVWPNTILSDAVFGSLGISLVSGSIFYIRKMYKTCINQNVLKSGETNTDKYRELGTIIYFTVRPVFTLGFALLIVVGLKSGLIAVTLNAKELSRGFVYLCMFFSFICGFSSGKLINYIEEKGTGFFPKILPKE